MTTEQQHWTPDDCRTEALKYATLKEWRTGSPDSYLAASQNGWVSTCSAHMPTRGRGWGITACLIRARQFQTPEDWAAASPVSHRTAMNRGWFKRCTAHMGLQAS